MDDIDDLQDIQDFQDMAEVLVGPQRPRREKPDFMEEITDFEFKRTFRFTKDGVESLVGLLAPYIGYVDNRGQPLTPLQQVLSSLFTK